MAEKEYIERNNVISHKRPFTEFDEGGWSCKVQAVAVEDIQNIPAADVAPVKHGHWINENFYTRCSACGNMAIYDKYGQEVESDYCPRCGAKLC